MREDVWRRVDEYLERTLGLKDEVLERTLEANRTAGLPPIDVSATHGRFLSMLVRMCSARRILEVGTLGGYSTIWMARELPEDGRLVTLEREPLHARVARRNIEDAGLAERVEVREGPATESLAELAGETPAPFDLVFIDADKVNNAIYIDWALRLGRPGTVIVCDNVIRGGGVLDSNSPDRSVSGARAAIETFGSNPRLMATALQTVGVKGHDGFAIAIVR
ncbi:MAG TPA: O-methyltransferase [Devosiaceae bacterium]